MEKGGSLYEESHAMFAFHFALCGFDRGGIMFGRGFSIG
jgi:hypothetical protein